MKLQMLFYSLKTRKVALVGISLPFLLYLLVSWVYVLHVVASVDLLSIPISYLYILHLLLISTETPPKIKKSYSFNHLFIIQYATWNQRNWYLRLFSRWQKNACTRQYLYVPQMWSSTKSAKPYSMLSLLYFIVLGLSYQIQHK